MSERAMNISFMGMFTTILKAMNIVSVVILLIMLLILGNTIAMGVRERTNEYGVLRAIGFLPKHIVLFVIGEAMTIGALGGALGILLSYPLIEKGIGRWLEENMGGWFPYFRIAESTAIAAAVLSIALGALAAAIPAYRASKLDVIDALRRVG
jgi:putative ABC transport system permease protein